MVQQVNLTVTEREKSTKSKIKTSRKSGIIPGIVYGQQEKNIQIWVNAKELDKIIHKEQGTNVLISLKVGDTAKTVLIKEIQRGFVSLKPIHVDFNIISLTKKIEVEIPIHITGEAPGVKIGGGILEHIIRELRVKCLPTEIPQGIDLDVSNLNINESLTVKDMKLPAGLEIITDLHTTVVNIAAPTKEEVVAPDEAAVAATAPTVPEVISKGKKEVEGEEAVTASPDAAAKDKGAPAAKDKAKK